MGIQNRKSLIAALYETGAANSLASKGHTFETSDNYERVLFVEGRYRISVCKQGLQWLFQQRVTEKPCAGARWRTLGYCTSKKALARLQHRFQGAICPNLDHLPEYFKPEGGHD